MAVLIKDYYNDSISKFLSASSETIFGELFVKDSFATEATQKDAWRCEVDILKEHIKNANNRL